MKFVGDSTFDQRSILKFSTMLHAGKPAFMITIINLAVLNLVRNARRCFEHLATGTTLLLSPTVPGPTTYLSTEYRGAPTFGTG